MEAPPIGPYPIPGPPAALRPWNPAAPAAAARIAALIADRLPDTVVEHVGSSAVPGCDGKGYLDFIIPYRDDAHLAAINHTLFALGFGRQRNDDPFPETRPMRNGTFVHDGATFLLHVHIGPLAGPEADELRAFRDRLRGDPALVAEYVAVKRAILEAGIIAGDDHAQAKEAFFAALGYKGAEGA